MHREISFIHQLFLRLYNSNSSPQCFIYQFILSELYIEIYTLNIEILIYIYIYITRGNDRDKNELTSKGKLLKDFKKIFSSLFIFSYKKC